MSDKKLVIIGAGEFAEIAYEYFTYDSNYDVVGFAVEKEFYDKELLYDFPVVAFEEIEDYFPVEEHDAFVAITHTKLNRIRTKLYTKAKEKGYKLATYISSKAFVWRNAVIGDNCFIFENNVIQHHVKIGNNVIMWSGNHVGHRSSIGNNCFISSHVVISGYCAIDDNCFIGVNSAFADNITLGKDSFVALASVMNKNQEGGYIYKGNPAEPSRVTTQKYFKYA